MKVTLDVSQAIFGTGVSDYIINLVQHLPPETMNLVGFSLRRQSELQALFPQAKSFPLPPRLAHVIWNQLHVLPVEIFAGKSDIFHSSDWTQPPTSALKVTTIHDLAPFILPHETSPQIVAVHQARMHWVVKECQKLICVSENTASDLIRLFPQTQGRVVVIAEALPTRFMIPAQPSPCKDYLFAIGSTQPRKNLPRLINAYLHFKKTLHLPEKLIIAGDCGISVPDPSVIFTGYVPTSQLVNLLAGAEAFIYPSLYEGFGLPLLEAFYHQVPVVCSQTSSLPEVAGEAAILVDPYSEEALADGVSQALKKRSQLVASGRKRLTKFSWEKTAAQTLALYKSLC